MVKRKPKVGSRKFLKSMIGVPSMYKKSPSPKRSKKNMQAVIIERQISPIRSRYVPEVEPLVMNFQSPSRYSPVQMETLYVEPIVMTKPYKMSPIRSKDSLVEMIGGRYN